MGGTFTDLVALAPDGAIAVRKVVSTPDDPGVGLFRAVDEFRQTDGRSAPGGGAIAVLVHGTTVATNALLERSGARVVLVTTAGFEDVLWLRRQDRAALYDLARDYPPPLVAPSDVIGAAERMGPRGVVDPLGDDEVARVAAAVRARRPEAVAVSLLFAFLHPTHEQRLAAALRIALPGVPVVASHEVLPVFREYERTSTTTAEAYLRPLVSAYVTRAAGESTRRGIGALRIMTSAGGSLAPDAAAERSAALALSGPAGGVVGARLLGEAAGMRELLTLDMGGTSADASLVTGGTVLHEGSGAIGGIPLALPATLIETVSAGGGSIASVDEGGALKVGPRSAGAAPGPACYGRGGVEPTVTDACLVLGWLDPDQPLADGVRLDRAAADGALGPLAARLGMTPIDVAAGIVAVAVAVMARALKRVSVARGVDPRLMTLVPFGGAGPLFGCALADALGMRAVLVPPHPGVLSALGLAAAPERIELVAPFHRPLALLTAREVADAFQPLLARAAATLPGATLARVADCRFVGQGYEVAVPAPADDGAALARAFLGVHRARHGHADPTQPIELVQVRVTAVRPGVEAWVPPAARGAAPAPGRRAIVVGGRAVDAALWPLGGLPVGAEVTGPAILAGPDATALVEPGWHGRVHASGAVVLARSGRLGGPAAP